jgi:AraC family transcriptional regulator
MSEGPRPVERVLFQSEQVEVGAFRCPAGHPDFRHAGAPIRDHHVFVFPRSRVGIRHEGGRLFAADPNLVTAYNPGQAYVREHLDGPGDFADWFAVDNETAFEAARAVDPSIESPDRCFRFSHAGSDATTYLRQRELFETLRRGEGEPLAVEEQVLWLLERVVASAYGVRTPSSPAAAAAPANSVRDEEHHAVRRARMLLAERFRDPVSLAEIARTAGLSRYRLCRVFRAATGRTLHAYRDQLRLRSALEALASPSPDLTTLALDLGYSSHSHFTANFMRVFGLPPSQARRRLSATAGRWARRRPSPGDDGRAVTPREWPRADRSAPRAGRGRARPEGRPRGEGPRSR